MNEQAAAKVTGAHLARTAYMYVRQSTVRQVLTNTESTRPPYALRQKAIALGWPAEQIVTINTDHGPGDQNSGATPGSVVTCRRHDRSRHGAWLSAAGEKHRERDPPPSRHPGHTLGEHHRTRAPRHREPTPTLDGSIHSGYALAETAASDCRRPLMRACDEPCCAHRNTNHYASVPGSGVATRDGGIANAILLGSLLGGLPAVAEEDVANYDSVP